MKEEEEIVEVDKFKVKNITQRETKESTKTYIITGDGAHTVYDSTDKYSVVRISTIKPYSHSTPLKTYHICERNHEKSKDFIL